MVTQQNFSHKQVGFDTIEADVGHLGIDAVAIVCVNPDCGKAAINLSVCTAYKDHYGQVCLRSEPDRLLSRRLMPDHSAHPQPDYIPAPLVEDYIEACNIKDLSPKASATLARRCLQGMIRDFCGISKPTLFKEIEALKKLLDESNAPKGVSADSVEAIDHIRQIGNIGAHMEKDINVIIDVDPEEAQVLIELIETLFEEWYVARHKREERFARVKTIADEKAAQKLVSQ
ncbi:DUF4145 domain-containing protein [Leisingera sp. McT4-56]|uniref:DUF4145 domain-containing protein n=1 Tax=Leisingera sp. McT4-56 TaxID=2881255 RepID=UPI001CF80445|nr:DUF4145 domain-containing protein [Leisingera sp. McT4-56]MCB4456096.1 DUF4145 domain-containing protein [Leisingera sp. McT4-56]